MEGISQEAIALAGHLKLAKLIVLFDDNGISIDGPLSLADSVDQVKRFEAAGWAASRIDGHDPDAIAGALEQAQPSDRPTLIACKTTIGFGAPKKAGTAKCARRAARRRGDRRRRAGARLADAPPSRCRARRSPPGARPAARGRTARTEWQQRLAAQARRQPRRVHAPHRRRPARRRLPTQSPRSRTSSPPSRTRSPPARRREMALEVADRGGARDDRRLRRPHRLQQHPHQER